MSDRHSEAQVAPRSPTTISHYPEKKPRPSSSSSSPPSSSPCRAPSSASPHHDHTSAIPTTSLATFLLRDIHPEEGHRLLLPFLTTMDRLRLSECSQCLLDYRSHLSKVKVVNPHPSVLPTPGDKKGLAQLLLQQRGLEYLRLRHTSMLQVLDLASLGWLEGLKTLDLSYMRLDEMNVAHYEEFDEEARRWAELCEVHAGFLARAFHGGGLSGLEELKLIDKGDLGPEACEAVVRALKAGVCPQLRRLNLANIPNYPYHQAYGRAIARALESRHLHHLEELDLSLNNLGQDDGGAAVARAVQGGACPQLVKLNLSSCQLSREACQALGETMRSGSCVKLEDLDLRSNRSMGDEGFMGIFEALEAGSCPSLKRLHLSETLVSVESATALSHALQSGNCHHLQELHLWRAFKFMDRDASLRVLQAIQQGGRVGALSNLLHLNMDTTNMGQEHGRVLGEAIGGGALPQLEVLWVARNTSMGDGGVVPIMAGLEGGGCRHLKTLRSSQIDMGPQGGHALARALASGHLSCLQDFDVHWNQSIRDEVMAEVIKRLRQCHQLRRLDVGNTGMGVMAGQALVQALRDKDWPELEELYLSCNHHLLCDEGVVAGLAEVLQRRADHCLRLKEVKCEKSGLDEEGEVGGRLARLLKELQRRRKWGQLD